jgi:uncharacterized protein
MDAALPTRGVSQPVRRLGLPNPGDGVGLRDVHFDHLMRTPPAAWGVDWFEIISENYIDNHGYAAHVLDVVRAHRPVVMHGVSMSLGASSPLNMDYLRKLRDLIERIKPLWVSDHLCWTGVQSVNTHDLLPMPLTEAALAHVADRVKAVQDFLGRPLIIENASTYLEFRASDIPEAEFIARLTEETGCGLLLDVNNVYVSSRNHGFDPVAYIEAIPADRVVQMHLAGPTDQGDYLIDTHDHPVHEDVWPLYALAQRLCGGAATLLEWDAQIPPWDDLVAELNKAKERRSHA